MPYFFIKSGITGEIKPFRPNLNCIRLNKISSYLMSGKVTNALSLAALEKNAFF
jgi:hypothetical protein